MKQRIKVLLLTLLTLGILAIVTGCGGKENQYQTNDRDGYTVSVKYDANGGTFNTNTSVSVIVDSFNITDKNTNGSGKIEIALISPDNEARENDAFTAVKDGYFLAGWYEERTEIGKDENGDPIYSYGKKWDFDGELLEVDPGRTYTSSEPVMTLYAAWVPLFEIEFYDNKTQELLTSITYDPSTSEHIEMPAWDEKNGIMDMKDFPQKEGYAFGAVYLDKEGQNKVTEDVIAHPGSVDYERGMAKNPTMKLYVEWASLLEYEFYDLETGELLSSLTYDPNNSNYIEIPTWDEETGTLDIKDFPEKEGYTFEAVYLDEEGKSKVTEDVIAHSGNTENSTMKLYVDWVEGEWYHIYNAEQFVNNASVDGCYEIHADLDFSEEIWPTSLMYGNFNGIIHGNGFTLKNIKVTQTNTSKINAGLFGKLADTAKITDVTFDNVTMTIKNGTRVSDTNYGLFAGTISDEAVISNVSIVGSTLQIDSGCYFGTTNYSIGLLCGMGDESVIENAEISCVATGDNPGKVKITVEGNEVTVEIDTQ